MRGRGAAHIWPPNLDGHFNFGEGEPVSPLRFLLSFPGIVVTKKVSISYDSGERRLRKQAKMHGDGVFGRRNPGVCFLQVVMRSKVEPNFQSSD